MQNSSNLSASFSNVISSGKGAKPPSSDEFPALSSRQGGGGGGGGPSSSDKARQDILMSNLLGGSKANGPSKDFYHNQNNQSAAAQDAARRQASGSIGSSIMTSGNMELKDSSSQKRLFTNETTASSGGTDPKNSTNGVSNESVLQDQYGMLGMVEAVRMTNQDKSMLALGSDLTSLGLDLNGESNIYSTFMTPFSDSPSQSGGTEPVFQSHAAYYIRLPPPLSKLKYCSDETIFYIFYAMPRDVLQEAAAQELYSRSWRFHKEFKLWLTKDPAHQDPIQKGIDFERGVYVFFDPATWTKVSLERILYFDHLEDRYRNNTASSDVSGITTGIQRVELAK